MGRVQKLMWILILVVSVGGLQAQNEEYVKMIPTLTKKAAFDLVSKASENALELNKNVSVVILDAGGNVLLAVKGDDVGVHNTEASRKKAFTALSTKTASFELMKKAAANPYSSNLNTVPELLLLGGGVPIWKDGALVGSIGVSGGGGSENDHLIAKKSVENLGLSTNR